MEIGIVGLPNVGKSSLFNALTAAGVASENFPFTTIEPNVGVVPVNDPRLDFLKTIYKAPKIVPAAVRFVDIAGLVPGASQGEGLGNKFLSHIRAVDAIAQVVRCFDNKDVVNVLGELDPQKDADIIATELILADLEQAESAKEKLAGLARTGVEKSKKTILLLNRVVEKLKEGVPIREQEVNREELREFNFLTGKPLLYVANTNDSTPNSMITDLNEWCAKRGARMVVLNVKLEAEVMSLPQEERAGYRDALGVKESGLDRLAKEGQRLLRLITFFAAGPKEVHAWNIAQGSPVLKAAGKIHSDMERGFIRAEVFSVADLMEEKSEAQVKSKGKIRMEGRDYIARDGDVLNIHFKV